MYISICQYLHLDVIYTIYALCPLLMDIPGAGRWVREGYGDGLAWHGRDRKRLRVLAKHTLPQMIDSGIIKRHHASNRKTAHHRCAVVHLVRHRGTDSDT
jgi:hypothetical protein